MPPCPPQVCLFCLEYQTYQYYKTKTNSGVCQIEIPTESLIFVDINNTQPPLLFLMYCDCI